jgi:hypothetical protein
MESTVLSIKLKKEYSSVFSTRKRIEKIALASSVFLAKKDLDSLYDGIFLKSVTMFEAFLEEFFIGLLYDKYNLKTRKKVQKIIFPSKKLTLNYLMGNKNYLDLLPYEKLSQHSKIFFNTNNPFLSLTQPEKDLLNDIYIIRNAIAHSSVNSNKKFLNFLNKKHPSTICTTPSKFLQSLKNSNQTMFEAYIIELNYIANKLTNYN